MPKVAMLVAVAALLQETYAERSGGGGGDHGILGTDAALTPDSGAAPAIDVLETFVNKEPFDKHSGGYVEGIVTALAVGLEAARARKSGAETAAREEGLLGRAVERVRTKIWQGGGSPRLHQFAQGALAGEYKAVIAAHPKAGAMLNDVELCEAIWKDLLDGTDKEPGDSLFHLLAAAVRAATGNSMQKSREQLLAAGTVAGAVEAAREEFVGALERGRAAIAAKSKKCASAERTPDIAAVCARALLRDLQREGLLAPVCKVAEGVDLFGEACACEDKTGLCSSCPDLALPGCNT